MFKRPYPSHAHGRSVCLSRGWRKDLCRAYKWPCSAVEQPRKVLQSLRKIFIFVSQNQKSHAFFKFLHVFGMLGHLFCDLLACFYTFSVTFRVFLAHFLAQIGQNLSFDYARQLTFKGLYLGNSELNIKSNQMWFSLLSYLWSS